MIVAMIGGSLFAFVLGAAGVAKVPVVGSTARNYWIEFADESAHLIKQLQQAAAQERAAETDEHEDKSAEKGGIESHVWLQRSMR